MENFVYIIESLKDKTLYKGYSTDCYRRLDQHDNAESRYTKHKIPWKLIYIEKCPDKASALKREKSLKRANSQYLRWLLDQPSNMLR